MENKLQEPSNIKVIRQRMRMMEKLHMFDEITYEEFVRLYQQ